MDHGDEKRMPHPMDAQDEDEHPDAAPGLPSYQEATSELRQPPPAYLAPDASHTLGAYNPATTFLDGKRRAAHQDAAPPTSSSSSSPSEPSIKYIVTVQNATLQLQKKIDIRPGPGPGDLDPARWDHDASDVRWEVYYRSKYEATMERREGRVRCTGPEPSMANVATFKYPEFIWPGWCGVDITFLLNEVDGTGRGAPGKKFMHCTGVMTTKYTVDLPVMRHQRYVWQKTHRGLGGGENRNGSSQGGQVVGDEKQRLQQYYAAMENGGVGNIPAAPATTAATTPQNPSSSSSPHGSAAGAALDISSLFTNNWTPFTTQYLVDAQTESHVLAQYTRSAPWASERGILEVFPHSRRGAADDGGLQQQPLQVGESAFIEGVVISCAAMVGMQDRLGLVSSLVEAGVESYAATGKGKGRA